MDAMNETWLNASSTKSDCSYSHIAPYIGYIIIGFLAFLTNLVMSMTILREPKMRRKELMVFFGLSFSDMIFGLGNFITGCRRTQLSCQGRAFEQVNTRFCQREIHPVLWLGAGQHSSLMMVLLSIDRLMAVITFKFYMGLTKRYAITVVSLAYLFTFTSIGYGVTDGYWNSNPDPSFDALCNAARSTNPEYSQFSFMFDLACGVTCCSIYVIVLLANFYSIQQTQNDEVLHARMKTQRRLTVTLGISTFFTFLFHTVPFIILVVGTYNEYLLATIGHYMGILTSCNASINMFLFMWRHKRFRDAVLCRSRNAVNPTTNNNNDNF